MAQKTKKKMVYLVPSNRETDIIRFVHEPLHIAPREMIKEIEKTFIFPKLRRKVSEYVKDCVKCVAAKPDRSYRLSTSATSTPNNPFQSLEIDLCGPFPESSAGNKYILSVIDTLTRFCILKALPNKEASSVIKKLDDIFLERGLPLSIKSDNGLEFKNQKLEKYLNDLKIAHKFSSPYRPRSNGLVERQNQKIGHFLKLFESKNETWDEDLKLIALAINHTFHKNLNSTPFEMFHGWKLSND